MAWGSGRRAGDITGVARGQAHTNTNTPTLSNAGHGSCAPGCTHLHIHGRILLLLQQRRQPLLLYALQGRWEVDGCEEEERAGTFSHCTAHMVAIS